MTIHDELIEIQQKLTQLEDEDKKQEAIVLFDSYSQKLCEVGPYTIKNWPLTWTKTVWEFASKVKEDYSNLYINKLDSLIKEKEECSEQLEFLKSELMWDKEGGREYRLIM